MELKVIAHIRNDFPEKFGLPRQSGLVESVTGRIVFEKAYRDPNALRGLEDFSHLWLIWGFSRSEWKTEWSPTVRPPRLGGNKRMGVFATRAPYRPNPIGLSCVKIARIDMDTPEGPVIHVLGADLMDGTPIYDVKPYLPYSDSRPDAKGGFGEKVLGDTLGVVIPEKLLMPMPRPAASPERKRNSPPCWRRLPPANKFGRLRDFRSQHHGFNERICHRMRHTGEPHAVLMTARNQHAFCTHRRCDFGIVQSIADYHRR
jgi:tRNA-Thr(GGU) m(6)t(6)A37 methyltransferase TsaA